MKTLLIIILLFSVNSLFCQWSTDPEVNNPIAVKNWIQSSSLIVSDAKGGAIISWYSYEEELAKYRIYAQRINRAGNIEWTEGGILVSTSISGTHIPHMTIDGEGGAIISWFEPRTMNRNEDFAQRINADGQFLWMADGVSVGTVENHFQHGSPAITSDSAGGAVLAWSDWRGDFSDLNLCIRAQKIGAGGSILWESGGVALCQVSENSVGDPEITSDGNSGAIVVWDEWEGDLNTGNRNIYAQRITSGGLTLWGSDGLPVCTQINNQRHPIVCSDGNGGAIIVWQDYRNGSSAQLFAQKINAAGEVQWATDGIPVVNNATSNQDYFTVINDGEGGAFIAIQFGSSGVAIQHLNSGGEMLWGETGSSPNEFTDARYPDLVTDGQGGIFVAWTGQNYDIYTQHMNAAAGSLWYARGVVVCNAYGNQMEPKITLDDSGGIILTWDDYRSLDNPPDIYAQRISKNGLLEQPEEPEEPGAIGEPASLQESLSQNHPNPFSGVTRIDYLVSSSDNVNITIYDVTGKAVASPVNTSLTPGPHTLLFDAAGLPAGIYFYKFKNGNRVVTKSMMVNY